MSSELPIAVVGHGDEMILSAKGILAAGGSPMIFFSEEDWVTPFSLIRGSWLGETLGIKFICPDGEDTTDTFRSLVLGFHDPDRPFAISATFKQSLAAAIVLTDRKQLAGTIFCGDLSQVCLDNNHDFSVTPVWQTFANCEHTPDAHLQENDDFSAFPWSHCWTVAGRIVKIYPGSKPPISTAKQKFLPVSTTCTCLDNKNVPESFAQIGPSANWNPRHHRRDIFQEAKTFADKILNSPGLF